MQDRQGDQLRFHRARLSACRCGADVVQDYCRSLQAANERRSTTTTNYYYYNYYYYHYNNNNNHNYYYY